MSNPNLLPTPGPAAASNQAAPEARPKLPGALPPGSQPKPPSSTAQGAAQPVGKTAAHAKVERRHRLVALSFLVVVAVPMIACAVYLWSFAKDQYASNLGFSVRSEGSSSMPLELLGGIAGLSENSTSDPDILYKFLTSAELVQNVDARLDLKAIWSRAKDDPLFTYQGDGTIESLLAHWNRKVSVYSDSGMIDVRILAFEPRDAQAISQAIFDESSAMINDLNAVSRADSIRYAREELDKSVERLKEARQTMTEFRDKYQLVDPRGDVEGQLGILSLLQQQLAEAVINRAILETNARESDPRLEQADVRIKVIREQIDQERKKFGGQTTEGEQLSSVVGEFERLAVDREFAERTYVAALAAYDLAQAQAQQKSRYLAAYVKPTLAQRAEYPERMKIFLITTSFLLLIWCIGVLVYYSVRNRR